MMKIVIASDSFKGSLSSMEVAQAVEQGIRLVCPDANVLAMRVADGGEGTTEAVVEALGGVLVEVPVRDPLGRPIIASYGIAGDTAIIDTAAASGLTLLAPEERDPSITSTYGTGQMIMDAMRRGCRHVLLGVGGSATNDAGVGMLQALGFRFYDSQGYEMMDIHGGMLHRIARIDDTGVPKDLQQTRFTLACDVDTPFCGAQGAAFVFAPQKGADAEMVRCLDRGMESFAQHLQQQYGVDIVSLPRAGAAGGLAGACHALLHAHLAKGIELVLDTIHFDEALQAARLVITGEGKIDAQTAKGKTAAGVLARAQKQGIPVIAIGGRVEMCDALQQMGFAGIYPITEEDLPIAVAMQRDCAMRNITKTIARLLRSWPS